MAGPIASSLGLVRSTSLLLALLSYVRRLLDIEFEGFVDLDEHRRGWIAADDLRFVADSGECLADLDRFRNRLIPWASQQAGAAPKKTGGSARLINWFLRRQNGLDGARSADARSFFVVGNDPPAKRYKIVVTQIVFRVVGPPCTDLEVRLA